MEKIDKKFYMKEEYDGLREQAAGRKLSMIAADFGAALSSALLPATAEVMKKVAEKNIRNPKFKTFDAEEFEPVQTSLDYLREYYGCMEKLLSMRNENNLESAK